MNRDASPEATALLALLYDLKGKKVLAGQHNYPAVDLTETVAEWTGKYPAVWGNDFSYGHRVAKRREMIREARSQWERGAVITLMYHATRPTDEPTADFHRSVSAELTVEQWDSLLTPGTRIHARWLEQIDSVAVLLSELGAAGVPVLWRPYHEMNGNWFWWSQRPSQGYRQVWRAIYRRFHWVIDPLGDLLRGSRRPLSEGAFRYDLTDAPTARASLVSTPAQPSEGFPMLWRLMYDRYTHHHKLNNLIWVWNAASPGRWVDPFGPYYPGDGYVDVLAVNVYGGAYDPTLHDELLALGKGKPIALGEIGKVPDPAIFAEQSQWTWFMVWGRFLETKNTPVAVRRLYADPVVLTLDDLPWGDPDRGPVERH